MSVQLQCICCASVWAGCKHRKKPVPIRTVKRNLQLSPITPLLVHEIHSVKTKPSNTRLMDSHTEMSSLMS